jgi:hypothetical protein
VILAHTLVASNGRATVLGVEVDADLALAGQDVQAEGELQNWLVTKALLKRNPDVAQLFGDRGPGEYWRLVNPTSGALVKPRVVSAK